MVSILSPYLYKFTVITFFCSLTEIAYFLKGSFLNCGRLFQETLDKANRWIWTCSLWFPISHKSIVRINLLNLRVKLLFWPRFRISTLSFILFGKFRTLVLSLNILDYLLSDSDSWLLSLNELPRLILYKGDFLWLFKLFCWWNCCSKNLIIEFHRAFRLYEIGLNFPDNPINFWIEVVS